MKICLIPARGGSKRIKNKNISDEEMYRTLNCGIGFMIVLDDENYKKAKYIFHKNKIEYCRAGYISKRTGEAVNFI